MIHLFGIFSYKKEGEEEKQQFNDILIYFLFYCLIFIIWLKINSQVVACCWSMGQYLTYVCTVCL